MGVIHRKVSKSQQRISSGQRINVAADDAAGSQLASSMTTELKGTSRAARNAYEGASLAKQADNALGSIAGILHNMRALAVQAANDTLLEADRQNIQVSVKGFVDEIDHIGSTTDFAGTRLLDGTYLNKGLHIGANFRENTLVSIADARATYLGRYAVSHTERMNHENLGSGELRINGIHVRATVDSDDQLSTTQRKASAISKAAAINDSFDRSNVNALINANEYAGLSDILGGTLDATNALFINEEAIGGYVITADDADEQLMTAINLVSHRTGVIASLNEKRRLQLEQKMAVIYMSRRPAERERSPD